MLFVKIPRIILNVIKLYYILHLLFLNSIVFTSFRLQSSKLNYIFNFVKKKNSDFIIGKIVGRLVFGLIR
jgi:hypothetical protein